MAKKKKQTNKRDALWAEAKKRCRLSMEDVRMAKEMGLNPRSLIKNIPSKSEPRLLRGQVLGARYVPQAKGEGGDEKEATRGEKGEAP